MCIQMSWPSRQISRTASRPAKIRRLAVFPQSQPFEFIPVAIFCCKVTGKKRCGSF